jgi:hypothetical protein
MSSISAAPPPTTDNRAAVSGEANPGPGPTGGDPGQTVAGPEQTGAEPMLSAGIEGDAGWNGFEAALPGAVRPPVEVRIEIDDLADESARIRRAGARALLKRRQRYPQVVSALMRAVADTDGEVRGLAAQALADLDIAESRDRIRPLLNDSVSWVRTQAVEALAKLGDIASLPVVLERIQDIGGWVRRLAGSGKPEALTVLARAMEIATPRTARDINIALIKLGVELERRPDGWHCRIGSETRWQRL